METQKNRVVLTVKNLSVEYYRRDTVIPAVRDVTFELNECETLAVVGESGCGKSTVALSILNLISDTEGKISAGKVLFNNEDLLLLDDTSLRAVRGGKVSMIFQDPFTSLNPVFTVGEQISECLEIHEQGFKESSENEKKVRVCSILETVKITDPVRVHGSYPHQLSGGMRQRVVIAMAVCTKPKLIIADEPTTALDVTIQKEILELMFNLKHELGLALILITHNLGIVYNNADTIAVMYAGEVVEYGTADEVIHSPMHPYTIGLVSAVPIIGNKKKRLYSIPGQIPDPSELPSGCAFHPRCERRMGICSQVKPGLYDCGSRHNTRCFLFDKNEKNKHKNVGVI